MISSHLRSELCWAKEFTFKLVKNQRKEFSNETAGNSPTSPFKHSRRGLHIWVVFVESCDSEPPCRRLLGYSTPLHSPSLQGWCWPLRLSLASHNANHPIFKDMETSDICISCSYNWESPKIQLWNVLGNTKCPWGGCRTSIFKFIFKIHSVFL